VASRLLRDIPENERCIKDYLDDGCELMSVVVQSSCIDDERIVNRAMEVLMEIVVRKGFPIVILPGLIDKSGSLHLTVIYVPNKEVINDRSIS
jgi:hypothetical protein